MAITVKYRGTTIVCDSSEEAFDMLGRLGITRSMSEAQADALATSISGTLSERAQALLITLSEVKPQSVNAEVLRQAFGISSVKGVGPVVYGIRNEIRGLGLDDKRVIVGTRGTRGPRWKAGPDIQKALERGGMTEE